MGINGGGKQKPRHIRRLQLCETFLNTYTRKPQAHWEVHYTLHPKTSTVNVAYLIHIMSILTLFSEKMKLLDAY